MSLDLGSLFATVDVITAPGERKLAAFRRTLMSFGTDTDKAASNVRVLDDTLIATGEAGTKAAAGVDRAAKATTASAAAADKAATAQRAHSAALIKVQTLMAGVADESVKVQQATLRQAAAQERLTALQESGTATTRQLASAQAGLIGATRSLAAAQEEGAVAGGRFRTSMAGMLKTAGELGLLIGAVEAVKKVIDITKEANQFKASMVLVQTNADVSAAEVNKASGALLKMAGPVAAAPDKLAIAWYHAKSVGLDYAKSIETTRIAAEGARVGHADLEQTMNALTSTVASGIPGVKNMSSAMGILIATVGSGDMKLSDLNDALGTGILSKMKLYGLSITDVGAALATFGDLNIRGAVAATDLRMGVEAMAKQGGPGVKALKGIGIEANQLRKDMQQGGLNKAVQDLNDHLKAAGITGTAVGGFLIDAFSKKGSGGVALLLSNIDRLESKFKILNSSGATFGEKWKATTQTASFALASLGHGLEAMGITLTAKLGPSIATAANWLGTTLPHALMTLQAILAPTEQIVGGAFVLAWHSVVAVLSVVGGALSVVGGFLKEHQALATGVATAVLGMWAAFKAYSIARFAVVAVISMINRLGAAAEGAGARVAAGMTGARLAMVGIGVAIGAVTYAWQQSKHQAEINKEAIDGYTAAIEADSGALGENTRKQVEHSLIAQNAYQAAHKLSISQKTLTDAVMGNAAAYAAVKKAVDAAGNTDGAWKVMTALGGQSVMLKQAKKDTEDMAAADGKGTTAQKVLAEQTKEAAAAAKAHAAAVAAQKKAADALNASLQVLAQTQLAASSADDAFREGILGVSAAVKQNGKSLSQNTAGGLANRDMLRSLLSDVVSSAQKNKDNGQSIAQVTRTMAANVRQIEATAIKAGLSKTQVQAMVKAMGLTPKQLGTKFNVDTRTAKQDAAAIQAQILRIRQGKVPGIDVNTEAAQAKIAQLEVLLAVFKGHAASAATVAVATAGGTGGHHADGGTVPGTGNADNVPILATPGEEVISKGPATRNRGLLKAINAGMFGYAKGGTVGHYATGGTVNGTHYTTDLGYQNAKARAAIAAQKRTASQDLTYGNTIRTDTAKLGKLGLSPTSTYSDVSAQISQTERDLRAAGIPKSFITGLANDNKKILDAVSARNNAAAHLALANQAVADAKNVKAQDVTAFKGAVTGSFDITSAGADANGNVTGGGILAQQAQAVTRAKAFVTGLTALIGKKIFPAAYIRSLAGQGPGALGQVQALLSLSASQMQTLATENNQLNTLGGQIAGTAAGTLDDAAITTAKANQTLWKGREADRQKDVVKANEKLAKDIGNELRDLKLTARLGVTASQLYVIVETGKNQAKPRGKTSH